MERISYLYLLLFTFLLLHLCIHLFPTFPNNRIYASKMTKKPSSKSNNTSTLQPFFHLGFPEPIVVDHGPACHAKNSVKQQFAVLTSSKLTSPLTSWVQSLWLSETSHIYLDSLIIRSNPNLTGSIPPSITKLTELGLILFNSNNLTGPIPNHFSKLPKLEIIGLNDSHFTGSIPSYFGHLPILNSLDFSDNLLTGTIPASFGFSPRLKFLQLSNNMLSGQIPRSLGNLNFEILVLTGNKFTGDASFLFGENKTNLAHLELGSNQLSFDLANVVLPIGKFNSSLLILDLSHNMIYGEVPAWIGEVPELFTLDLSYNQLCGPIPTSGGKLQGFRASAFEHNKCLCGAPLPPCNS